MWFHDRFRSRNDGPNLLTTAGTRETRGAVCRCCKRALRSNTICWPITNHTSRRKKLFSADFEAFLLDGDLHLLSTHMSHTTSTDACFFLFCRRPTTATESFDPSSARPTPIYYATNCYSRQAWCSSLLPFFGSLRRRRCVTMKTRKGKKATSGRALCCNQS